MHVYACVFGKCFGNVCVCVLTLLVYLPILRGVWFGSGVAFWGVYVSKVFFVLRDGSFCVDKVEFVVVGVVVCKLQVRRTWFGLRKAT